VTSGLQDTFNGSKRNFGLVNQGSGTGSLEIYSSDHATAANRPKLIVTFTANQVTPYESWNSGAPRSWESGVGLNPHQVENLLNGNVLTSVPITGWQGFGPGVGMTLYHNSRQDPAYTNTFGAHISCKWTHNYADQLWFSGTMAGDGT
jgi:hypothetical protein